MTLLTRMLCRWCACVAPGPGKRESAADKAAANSPDESSSDDLTAISGIGIATQDRLNRAGIKSYGQLARTSPAKVREILVKVSRGADVKDWITQAKQLVNEGKS